MSAAITLLAVFAAVLAQVTVAPLFPLGAAIPDLVLGTLMAVAVFAGPRKAMFAIPVAAILLSFASDRSAGLLLLAYLPLLPIAVLLAATPLPLNRFAQAVVGGIATGIWARMLLASAAIAGGADAEPAALVFSLALPGVLLDALVLASCYMPFRVAGREPRALSLQRTGYYM